MSVKKAKRSSLPQYSIFGTVCVLLVLLGFVTRSLWFYQQEQRVIQEVVEPQEIILSVAPPVPTAEEIRQKNNIALHETGPDTPPLVPATVAPMIHRINTTQPVIFVTIDDGVHKSEEVAQYIIEQKLPFTAFLTISVIESNYDYFRRLEQAGVGIQNHTITHRALPRLNLHQQRHEICVASDILAEQYSKRPTLLRPPYGEYNAATQQAAADCGIQAIVNWSALVDKGVIYYQTPEGRLRPGDIVLLHFGPNLKTDIEALMKAAHEQGFAIGKLEDWLR